MQQISFLSNNSLLLHFGSASEPFFLKRKDKVPGWQDELFHRDAFSRNPSLYALCALEEGVQPAQRVRVLFQVLSASWRDLSQGERDLLSRAVALLLVITPADDVLQVFLALRRVRANHRHTARAILRYLVDHPALEDLAARRRAVVVDILEHALGKNVARGCAKVAAKGEGSLEEEAYLRRNFLRFAKDPGRARKLLGWLYHGKEPPKGKLRYTEAHYTPKPRREEPKERPRTITATNRGEIAAALVHIYRGGANEELLQAIEDLSGQAATTLPRFSGKIALVLDVSASMQGYGERSYSILSQAVALMLCLQKCCDQLEIWTVGGTGFPPRPEGETDLAMTLLDALEGNPDLAVIVSDGYENVEEGDLARVVASLPGAGVDTPVVFCHSKFTYKDLLDLRRPAKNLLELSFWHQDDFEELFRTLFSVARGKVGETFLQEISSRRLTELEREVPLWIAIR